MSQGLHRLKDGLAKLIGQRGYGYSLSAEACEKAWKEAVGELFFVRTQVGALRRKILEITVADSVSMQELTFRKASLLATLQKKLPDHQLQDLRFRIGHIQPLNSVTENQE